MADVVEEAGLTEAKIEVYVHGKQNCRKGALLFADGSVRNLKSISNEYQHMHECTCHAEKTSALAYCVSVTLDDSSNVICSSCTCEAR